MKKYILIFASAALILFSCTDKDDNIVVHDSIATSADTLKFGPDGGVIDLKVTSSGDWRLSGLCDWVTPSVTEGKNGATITFTAEPSDSKEAKESSFKIFTGSAVKKIIATAVPAYVVTLTSEEEVNFVSDGGSTNVKIDTNIPELQFEYSGDGADWITFGQRSDAFGMTLLQFNVKRSQAFKSRESVVTIKGEGKSATVKFVQAQRDTVFAPEERTVYDLAARNVEIKVKTNIEFDYSFADWMTKTGETTGVPGDDGLTEKTIKVHLAEAAASRFHTFEFSKNGNVYGKYTIKQQNPNPVLCGISDPKLRAALTDLGWIIGDESSPECEVLEPGLTGTTLSLAGQNYSSLKIDKIDGLGAFPKLETLSLTRCDVSSIDVSDSKSLRTITLQQVYNISDIKTGDSPVTDIDFGTYRYDYIESTTLVISGKNISSVKANNSSYYISYYEQLASVDVTGCPALAVLNMKREYSGWGDHECQLKTIYVTAAQKAAIDAGTLTVEKSDLTSIEVK